MAWRASLRVARQQQLRQRQLLEVLAPECARVRLCIAAWSRYARRMTANTLRVTCERTESRRTEAVNRFLAGATAATASALASTAWSAWRLISRSGSCSSWLAEKLCHSTELQEAQRCLWNWFWVARRRAAGRSRLAAEWTAPGPVQSTPSHDLSLQNATLSTNGATSRRVVNNSSVLYRSLVSCASEVDGRRRCEARSGVNGGTDSGNDGATHQRGEGVRGLLHVHSDPALVLHHVAPDPLVFPAAVTPRHFGMHCSKRLGGSGAAASDYSTRTPSSTPRSPGPVDRAEEATPQCPATTPCSRRACGGTPRRWGPPRDASQPLASPGHLTRARWN